MKKNISLALVLVMVLSLFAGCGSKTETPAAPAATEAAAPVMVIDNSSETFDVASLTADQLANVKVGYIFLHDENSTYDLNFMNAAKAACDGLGVPYVMKTQVPEGEECYETACDLVDEGCTVIFADSFGHEPYLIQAAQENPDVQFCHATGTRAHTEGLANYHNAFATIFEGRFLAGIAAGMKLNEMIEAGQITAEQAKIGYVGAFTYAEVVSGYTSFFLGARSVCPTATMEVTFTGSWYDETAEKEGANTLINNGCVLISQHADSMGAPTACETAGVPNVAYNGSTAAACPNTFIVSSRIDWVTFMQWMIGNVASGNTMNADWTGTLENGAVALTDVNEQAAAAGTVEAIAEAKAKLIDGSMKVFDLSTFTVEGKTLDSFAPGSATDGAFDATLCKTVVDGAIAESGYRSAPFFDLTIDGITLLDTRF